MSADLKIRAGVILVILGIYILFTLPPFYVYAMYGSALFFILAAGANEKLKGVS